VLLAAGTGAAEAQTPSASCGDKVTVQGGDTLSSIAQRCGVSERNLMRLNPRIDGSSDLRVGMELRVGGEPDSSDPDLVGRLRSFANDAAELLSGLARDAQTTAEDILAKNPDLRQRLERWSQQLRGSPTETEERTISVSPSEGPVGATVTVTAKGLPRDTNVVVGAGRPQAAYQVIERAKTGSDGTLRTSVRIPDWAGEADRLVIVVAAENSDWILRSQPIRVTGTRL
jgi:murein DD-endopeptidase MepM/ murein hydrolase activator NlpD